MCSCVFIMIATVHGLHTFTAGENHGMVCEYQFSGRSGCCPGRFVWSEGQYLLGAVPLSSDEPAKLLQWLCQDDRTLSLLVGGIAWSVCMCHLSHLMHPDRTVVMDTHVVASNILLDGPRSLHRKGRFGGCNRIFRLRNFSIKHFLMGILVCKLPLIIVVANRQIGLDIPHM